MKYTFIANFMHSKSIGNEKKNKREKLLTRFQEFVGKSTKGKLH